MITRREMMTRIGNNREGTVQAREGTVSPCTMHISRARKAPRPMPGIGIL
jgi:hypothetical protein